KKDALVWLPEKSGTYSTKSGYALTKLHTTSPGPEVFNWRLNIWNLSIPPKLKMFLWKIKRKALPVGGNLTFRGINCDLTCKRCGLLEDELHILLLCPYARRVWELAPIHLLPSESSITSLAL
ncbi:unnamed protein product, partial [Arabidopsis halleri]